MCLMKVFPVLKVLYLLKLSFICYARLCVGYILYQEFSKGELSYKVKKAVHF